MYGFLPKNQERFARNKSDPCFVIFAKFYK